MRRHKMSRQKSRKDFSSKSGLHPKNTNTGLSRGGIYL